MEPILTDEEKKYLRFFVKFLYSYGETTGTFRLEDFSEDFLNFAGPVSNLLGLEENYYLDVPEQITPIIEKVINYCEKRIPSVDEDISSTSLEIVINSEGSITAEYCWRYYTRDDQSESFDSNDGNLNQVFDELSENHSGLVYVKFDGNGDSGQIEQAEDESGSIINVSANVEDWCYNQLESKYGGWEINEGSSGQFIFDLDNNTCELEFGWNNENTECDTLYEEKFDK